MGIRAQGLRLGPPKLGESPGELGREEILGGLAEVAGDPEFREAAGGEPDRLVDRPVRAPVEGDRIDFVRILAGAIKDHDEGLVPGVDVAGGRQAGGEGADPLLGGLIEPAVGGVQLGFEAVAS